MEVVKRGPQLDSPSSSSLDYLEQGESSTALVHPPPNLSKLSRLSKQQAYQNSSLRENLQTLLIKEPEPYAFDLGDSHELVANDTKLRKMLERSRNQMSRVQTVIDMIAATSSKHSKSLSLTKVEGAGAMPRIKSNKDDIKI